MLPNNIIDIILDFIKNPCDDCGRLNIKLIDVHGCDDWKGCCYKRVCHDNCIYYCKNNHGNISECPKYFCSPLYNDRDDPYEDEEHKYYDNHTILCHICYEEVYIKRNFIWESHHIDRC